MITVLTLSGNKASVLAKRFLQTYSQSFIERNIQKDFLTYQEFKYILFLTEEGLDELLAKTKARKDLEAAGIDFEELTLSEFYHLYLKHPSIVKAPILIDNNSVVIGFEEDEYAQFIPRGLRKKEYSKLLETVREEENERILNDEKISGGRPKMTV